MGPWAGSVPLTLSPRTLDGDLSGALLAVPHLPFQFLEPRPLRGPSPSFLYPPPPAQSPCVSFQKP